MAKIDKNELIAKVQGLDGLTNDEKAQLISFIKTKTYGLVWENSTEKSWEQMKDYIPVLVEDKDKAIINDTETQKNPNHILIEGDNLLALTNLCYTHAGKVDVIYIDPPYNTGSDGFTYNDKRVGEDDEYRHSKWLSFMNKRLMSTKKLLSENGVIFISIGDHEQAALKLLCDQVFGEQNFVDIVARKAKAGSDQGTYFRPCKDYILVYAKNIAYLDAFSDKSIAPEGRSYPFTDSDGRKYRKAHSLFQSSLDPLRGCKNQRYFIKAPDGTLIIPPGPHLPVEKNEGGKLVPETREDKVWRWSCDSFLNNKQRIMFARSNRSPLIDSLGNPTTWNVYEKKYEDEEFDNESYPLPDDFLDRYLNATATTLLNSMGIDFSFSKPYELIKHLIDITDKNKNITILDFFAGSGTTLHATMQLNAEDGGNRQCILVTNNENNICEDVTYVRNERVINGYTKPNGESIEGLHNNNLRYYKVVPNVISRDRDLRYIEAFAHFSVPLLSIKEDVYKEQKSLGELECDGFRYFKDGNKQFIVILEPDTIESIVEELAKMDVVSRIPVYVFTMGQYPYTEDFWQVSEKVELYPYPSCIYGACEKVMPKKEDKLIEQPEDIELSAEEANITFEDLSKE